MADWSKKIHCQLTIYERDMAFDVARRRLSSAHSYNARDTHGAADDDCWSRHIEGAQAECAFAKATNQYWSGSVNTFKNGGDVGIFEVRWRSHDSHDLIIRHGDDPIRPYVLVTGRHGDYFIVGYCQGASGMLDQFFTTYDDKRPEKAYFVRQEALRDIAEVVDYCKSGKSLKKELLPPLDPQQGYQKTPGRSNNHPLPNYRDQTLLEMCRLLNFTHKQTAEFIQQHGRATMS